MRALAVAHVFSLLVMLFAVTMLVPLAIAWFLDDGALLAYDEAVLITLGTGALLWLTTRSARRELEGRDGFLLVALVWALLPVFGSIPLMLAIPGLSFTEAYFEAVSGLTATGATVLSGLDTLPPSVNIWRGLMQWLGGIGVVVLAVAILPMLGVGGRQLLKAETPGPMKDTKLTPRITETAKGLWLVYVALTLLCFFAYHLGGMSWLDALMHSFTTLGLAGFSTHDASFGYFDSPLLEGIAIFFMLAAGINFATHFMVFRRRSLGAYVTDPEAKIFLALMAVSVTGVALHLWLNGVYPDFGTALRYAAFNTVSVATTTGYATADFGAWPAFAGFFMLFLGSFATSSGSTGGGIKLIRARLLFAQVYREFVRLVHPNAVSPAKIGRTVVPNNIIFAVLGFFFVFIGTLTTMTLVMMASGLDEVTAVSAVVATLCNIGPGLGGVGPGTTFASLNDFQTWLCSLAMLLGRLELFTLFVLLTPVFWRR
ncbi:MAG TPA: potassium transporter TrkG [Pelomicrobium sp.]|nr:potassium transporter TrkG [Pelomicrobium sp.]